MTLKIERFFFRARFLIFTVISSLILSGASDAKAEGRPTQYILLNRQPAWGWSRGHPDPITREEFMEVRRGFSDLTNSHVRLGTAFVFSYFRASDDKLLASLRSVLQLSEETDTPVYIQLDGEQWWEARPDLWNWWDPSLPGYNPKNRDNVEWSSWSSKDALKIGWRNWGQQMRVRPPPNLMSPAYRDACHQQMELLVPVILQWWQQLPSQKKDLLVGIKVGWESSIGVNAFYYPHGNRYLDKPREDDPKTGAKGNDVPSRGVAQIGYAAVKTAGIRTKGKITEADLAEVVRRHLEDLCAVAARLGIPRDRLFTHGVGWKENELNYRSAINKMSCPGWSFYKHAGDPSKDIGVQNALKESDAPFWAATEWLFQGPRETEPWRRALENTLRDERCRFVCIYNWESIRESEPVLQAIREVLASGTESKQHEAIETRPVLREAGR